MLSGFDFSVVYIDDIIMNSKSVIKYDAHAHAHKVFGKIQDFGFKIKVTKCDFFLEKIKYLKHMIDKDGKTRS